MTKAELVKDMRAYTGSGFITRGELTQFLGRKCPKGVDKFIRPLQRLDDKYYYIPDVAESIIRTGGVA